MKYIIVFTILSIGNLVFSQLNSVMNLSSSIGINNTVLGRSNSQILGANTLYKPKTLTLSAGPLDASLAYTSKFNSKKNWTLNKKELRFSFGVTQFLGDLGGRDEYGTDYSLKDLNSKSMSYMGMIGYRYRFANFFATTTSVNFGVLKGDDALVPNTGGDGKFRLHRNLSFRAPIIDISQRLDVMLYMYEKVGKRYSVKGLKGFKNRNEQIYLFGGVGMVAFMPQANFNGRWYNLRPLSTEGQGLVGGTKKYSPVAITVPFGFGFRVGVTREWRVGVEASYTKVFSDNLDDVNSKYYNKSLLTAQKGELAAALADRSTANLSGYAGGMQRGDVQNDSYYFINVVFTRNVTYRNYTKTYKRYKLPKSKYKF